MTLAIAIVFVGLLLFVGRELTATFATTSVAEPLQLSGKPLEVYEGVGQKGREIKVFIERVQDLYPSQLLPPVRVLPLPEGYGGAWLPRQRVIILPPWLLSAPDHQWQTNLAHEIGHALLGHDASMGKGEEYLELLEHQANVKAVEILDRLGLEGLGMVTDQLRRNAGLTIPGHLNVCQELARLRQELHAAPVACP